MIIVTGTRVSPEDTPGMISEQVSAILTVGESYALAGSEGS